jgi:hypothetical protein
LHFLIGYLDAPEIKVAVDLALDLEASFGLRGADALDNHLMTDQRLAAPVLRDEGE